MQIEIQEYDDKYIDQVINLFVDEYKVEFNKYKKSFNDFFKHEYQKDSCIRVIAINISGEVVGFQSFFKWPYSTGDRIFNSYQSGNSIVSKKARGAGIFKRLLDFSETLIDKYKVDFFVGFPVEASYKSFIKSEWQNPFNLDWYCKINNPLGFIFRLFNSNKSVELIPQLHSTDNIRLHNTQEFIDWRNSYQKGKYRIFTFKSDDKSFQVSHKINTRKLIISELIIGENLSNTADVLFLESAYKAYIKWLKRQIDITLISYCSNDNQTSFSKILMEFGIKKINRCVYFITKGNPEISKKEWILFRSDIDTW